VFEGKEEEGLRCAEMDTCRKKQTTKDTTNTNNLEG